MKSEHKSWVARDSLLLYSNCSANTFQFNWESVKLEFFLHPSQLHNLDWSIKAAWTESIMGIIYIMSTLNNRKLILERIKLIDPWDKLYICLRSLTGLYANGKLVEESDSWQ